MREWIVAGVDPMMLLFWIGMVWLGYVYLGYPLILGLLSLVHRITPAVSDDYLPMVSVLIAARNEEKDIGWKLSQTLGWDYPVDRLEVLVASDASDDRTDEIVSQIKDPRLTFLRLDARSGKSVALNRLAARARGDLIFFTDANSHIEPHCLRRIVRQFADERVGCVTGEMNYVKEAADSAIGSGERIYWGYESRVKYLESRIGSVLICIGSIFCIRRSLYTSLQPDVSNDLELPLRIGRAGYWVLYEPWARSNERASRSPGEEFARRRRICAQGLIGMWRLRSTLRGLRGWQFFSRKFLRWLTLVPLFLVLLSSGWQAASPPFGALLTLQLVLYGLALTGWGLAGLGRNGGRLVSVPFYVLLVNVAGLVGVIEACFGRRFQVWDIASLSRGRDAGAHDYPFPQ